MGAIVASLLNKATSACRYNAFFSNEGRQMEMLSSGCAVGIACTFSAPAGAVLYGIESTSKYFAVKNYWRSFFATTCAALIFRFAIAAIVPQHIAGTITAYYQTNFPNEVFLIEEIPLFALLGPIAFTTLIAMMVAILTYPEGFGRYIAGQYFLVAVCVSLYIPAGIFVPSFVIGACGGRIVGEILVLWWPDGFRGSDGPQIYPGLYAVVGAAAYTGAVTHSLSIAVIVCETTGQLCALLPVLIALMIGNAICSFLQPSIYESIIKIQDYPYLTDLPPSRISVHTMKVEEVMVKDIVFITPDTTYMELREILLETPYLRSYPFVTDKRAMILLGSVARKYLCYLLSKNLGPEPRLLGQKRKSRSASELLYTIGQFRKGSNSNFNTLHNGASTQRMLTDRNISGNTLLAHSPLHDDQGERGPLAPLLYSQTGSFEAPPHSLAQRAQILASKIDLDDVAIDSAPFQLVKGTSLYKVHTLFSLLALNHAYVTEKGRLVGVVALKELREALSNIYSRGAVPIRPRAKLSTYRVAGAPECDDEDLDKPLVTSAAPVSNTLSGNTV
ncbi:Voltage gated chloride channel [Parelaphostrongylus tenuis]|uniref:Voltage gated chloride channel n=1 Tax=Parelaphostrongylus tenuis TaxID=148309 RepID=A0AAD5QQE1_PARTN|nr:Voltage gated chloride channel [Parelaphostrongylus tenuis]